ncbi:AAA family ATPase [Geothrix terrae]|uniref:AAA family ATPase n=1 Tax=Geothrix terrae TaxID=2922720 RepID=UPI001FACE2D5|nr:AAA family ATPase [Geothrix terrae]
MSDISQEIIGWLHQQQDWLQEAAERLHNSGSLSEADIDHLVSRLKSEEGRKVTTSRSFEALGGSSRTTAELRLLSLGDIKGIENLAPRRPLDFGKGNLAVIYGPNGSGKSSYTRILKKACGKPLAKELKPHVFQAPPTERKCTIRYRSSGAELSVEWSPTGAALADLQSVDFFDADAAAFYLNKESEASYTPPAVALFEGLAAACNRVKDKLQAEQVLLVSSLPTLPPEHLGAKAGTAYQGLKADISEATLQRLIHWAEADQADLDLLVERLKVADPTLAARQKRATKTQVDQLVEELESVGAVLGQDQIQALRAARMGAQAKRKVATEAAKACAQSSKLQGIGTETWNALWKAARQYSQIPYPDQDFPVTGPGSRCLLCHQELSSDAQQRLRDFEAFVQGMVEAEATTAESDYDALLEDLPVALSEDEIRTRCEAAGVTQDAQLKILNTFWASVGQASERLKAGESEESAKPVEVPGDFLELLNARSKALESEAHQHDEDAKTFNRASALSQKTELEARKWVSQQSEAIQKEIERLKKVKAIEGWARCANSGPISVQAGKVAERVITTAYVTRFNAELKALGAEHIRVELVKTRTSHGKALHQLRLKGATAAQAVPDSVLSDGERRIVSLAAFLADVAEKPHAAPFVFDDPISSLDHDYEWQVAQRLAELAKDRQVLVFTHRLSLYGAMEDAAKKNGDDWRKDHLGKRYIESFGGASGHPANEAAWNAKTKTANNILLSRLTEAMKAAEVGGGDAYRLHAQGICSDFRKLLERTVEDDLLNEVVKRHRRSVTTDNRIGKLPQITREDCDFIDGLMTKYSCYEHSQSQETPVFLPEEPALRADLEGLRDWREKFHQRGGGHA